MKSAGCFAFSGRCVIGEICWISWSWNPPDFIMKSGRFHMKSGGFHGEVWWISCMKSGRFHARCWKKQISRCKIFKTLITLSLHKLNQQFLDYRCLPLTVRPSTDEAAHSTAQVTQRSEPVLPQYKSQLCTFPLTTVPDTAEIIKAEPTARTTHTKLVLCTETWWQRWTSSSSDRSTRSVQKEKRLSHKGNKECSMLISVRKDRSSYGSFSCINQGSHMAQTPGGKGVKIQAEDFGHSGTKHLRISGSTCFKLLDVGLGKLCPKANSQLRFARGLQVKKTRDFAHKSHTR